jgi:arabinogalactan endo-1,4-beta-galactosidase
MTIKYVIFILFLVSCKKDAEIIYEPEIPKNELKGADISFLTEIRNGNVILYNRDNQPEDILLTLKKQELIL